MRTIAEARSAMEKFCDDFLCGILRTIDDRSAGTGTGLAWPEGFSMMTKTFRMSPRRGSTRGPYDCRSTTILAGSTLLHLRCAAAGQLPPTSTCRPPQSYLGGGKWCLLGIINSLRSVDVTSSAIPPLPAVHVWPLQ